MKEPQMPQAPKEPPVPTLPAAPAYIQPGNQGFVQGDELALEKQLFALAELKWEKEEAERNLRDINIQIDIQQRRCVDIMDTRHISNLKTDKAQFVRSSQTRPKVVNEDAFFADLEKNGLLSAIRRSVHHQTLVGIVNEREKNGEPPIDGVEVEKFPIVQVRRVGGARTIAE